eukprot:2408974-Prymnesium_polylepis.1
MLSSMLISGTLLQPPDTLASSRRLVLRRAALAATASSCASIAGLVHQQQQLLGSGADMLSSEWQDPLALQLRSATGAPARLERRRLEREWRQLRANQEAGRIGRAPTEAAFAVVLRVRRVVDEAEQLARAQADGWSGALEALVALALIAEFESAATVLASSSVLTSEARASIGWQWGACGWRSCGAQADAAQALCKLRANLGMLGPLEALFYLDVAKRSIDEMLLLGATEGFVVRSTLPRSEYLSAEALNEVLALDEDADGNDSAAADSHKVLGTRLRAEKQFDLEERVLLQEEQDDGV